MKVLYVTGVIVLFDQATKMLVKGFTLSWLHYYHAGMQLGSSIPILGNFLRLTFIENPGMAFGIDFGGRLFLTIFSLVASGAILVYLYRIRDESFVIRLALAVILGGAIGNLIDRMFYGVIFGDGMLFHGKVVDFIDVNFFNVEFFDVHISRWPVFNIADAAVSLGVILMLLFHRRFEKEGAGTVEAVTEGAKVDVASLKENSAAPQESVVNSQGSRT